MYKSICLYKLEHCYLQHAACLHLVVARCLSAFMMHQRMVTVCMGDNCTRAESNVHCASANLFTKS